MSPNTPDLSPSFFDRLRDQKTTEWNKFHQWLQPLILQWCAQKGILGSEQDDIAQQVWIGLWKQLREEEFIYQPDRNFRAYVRKIVQSRLVDLFRKKGRQLGNLGSGSTEIQKLLEQQPSPDVLELEKQAEEEWELGQKAMTRVREHLEPHTWEAFERTALKREKAVDVAAALNLSLAVVYKSNSRTKQKLREEVQRLREQREIGQA